MIKADPNRARRFIMQAKDTNMPVVNSSNPGYKNKSSYRFNPTSGSATVGKKKNSQLDEAIKRRMSKLSGGPKKEINKEEQDMIDKRKRVGY